MSYNWEGGKKKKRREELHSFGTINFFLPYSMVSNFEIERIGIGTAFTGLKKMVF